MLVQWSSWLAEFGRIGVLSILLVLGLGPTSAQAGLRFTQPVANAGVVRAGARLIHSFTFTNEGAEPVEITGIQASCGCLTPTLAQRTYRPGMQGTLELEVNTLSQAAGPHNWTVRMTFQTALEAAETVLELRAQVIAEIMVQPAAMVLFAAKGLSHEVIVTDRRPQPLTVTGVRTTSAKLEAKLAKNYRDKEGHCVQVINVHVSEGFSEGQAAETLSIYTDDPSYAELRVPVTVVKRSLQALEITPAEVRLTASPDQPFPARLVLIRDNQNRPVRIDRVFADEPAVLCHWAAGPEEMATLKIQIDRKAVPPGSSSTVVHVEIREPLRTVLTIPVSWQTGR